MRSIPEALSETDVVCSSVNIATSRAGINMNAAAQMGRGDQGGRRADRRTAPPSPAPSSSSSPTPSATTPSWPARITASRNPTPLSPSVSPAPVSSTGRWATSRGATLDQVAEEIKKAAFKITRAGQLVGDMASERLGVPFGIVDLSLAPTAEQGTPSPTSSSTWAWTRWAPTAPPPPSPCSTTR
ncbi:DUF711 family protein [Corynebacterium suedekumii]|nr:DUF711 family protein [Corynebacterium suedekumii]